MKEPEETLSQGIEGHEKGWEPSGSHPFYMPDGCLLSSGSRLFVDQHRGGLGIAESLFDRLVS